MKKSLFLGFVFLFMVFALAINLVSASDIAYIVKNPGNPDNVLIDSMNNLGLSYDLIDDSLIGNVDFSDYSLILIGNERIDNAPVNDYKSIVVNTEYYEGWSDSVGSVSSSQVLNAYNVMGSSITKGIEGNFKVYTSAGSIPVYYLSRKKYDCEKITTTGTSSSDLGQYAVAIKNNPRRVFFGITETEYWTQETKNLFENSIQWIFYGEDKDGDGFFGDEDCNDDDAEIWKNIQGYLDNDRDLFGTGDLIDVCSGEELKEGYSKVNGDCDDSDEHIYPDAYEVAYDGIDDDCDGSDLTDVDEDGYDSSLVGGEDCDDSDSSINPGSNDVYKNCINDKPIVESIDKIIVYENEIVEIIVNAVDPENDELDYEINSLNFENDNNVFTWQTGYYDEGEYSFEVEVSDGELSESIIVEAEVRNTNQIPLCNEIPDLEWDEDQTLSFDLNPYCTDKDGDKFVFYVQDTSSDKNITIDEIELGILELSVTENWNGEDWVIFVVSDGRDSSLTNKINLIVNPVNDEPVFDSVNNISDLNWNEDSDLIDEINLNDYFYDFDEDELIFDVSGNSNINIEINEGLVSFYPSPDWCDEETVIFSASDSEFKVYSNEVLLTVNDMNEPPEFEEINCENEILEDEEYNCELNALDFENDELVFNIISEDNLNCEINENELTYYSYENYFGEGSCLINVSDGEGYDEYLFEVSIENTNDSPEIVSFNPEDNVRILKGETKLFEIVVNDIDSEANILWFLDNEEVGEGNNYLFDKITEGDSQTYNLSAVVSDAQINIIHLWEIFVGETNYFSCEEVSGYECNENEICLGELIDVYNTNSCCSVACSEKPPEFNDINNRQDLTQEVYIRIKTPDEGDKLELEGKQEIRLDVWNNNEEELEFDVEVYLYDLTEDEIIEEAETSLEIEENRKKSIRLEIDVPGDVEEENEYAIFARVIEEDDIYYNEDYIEVAIKRKKHSVVIDKIEINEKNLVCGDYFNMNVKLENIGTSDEDVYIKVENSKLEIKEETEKFELEEYSEKNSVTKKFIFEIPEESEGEHIIKVTCFFNNERADGAYKLILGKCEEGIEKAEEARQIETIEISNLNSLELSPILEKANLGKKEIAPVFFVITTMIMLTALLAVCIFWIYKIR